MSTHQERAQRMYGKPAPGVTAKPAATLAAKPAAASKPQSTPAVRRSDVNYDRTVNANFEPRIVAARVNNNHLEVQRLEALRDETLRYAEEIGFTDNQAQQFSSKLVFRDRMAQKARREGKQLTPRETLNDVDRQHFNDRYKEQIAEVLHSAAVRSNELMATKPTLLAAVRETGAWLDRECVEAVADAVVAAGAVKPIPVETPKQ
jgi:hypothetical protein